jgi:hypothetical protein
VKIVFQNLDGLWEVDGKLLTDEELEIIQDLLHDVNWIEIAFATPKGDQIKNPAYVPYNDNK